jgi:hypothetical protein
VTVDLNGAAPTVLCRLTGAPARLAAAVDALRPEPHYGARPCPIDFGRDTLVVHDAGRTITAVARSAAAAGPTLTSTVLRSRASAALSMPRCSPNSVSRADIECILDKLDAPPSVSTEIDSTPAAHAGGDTLGPFLINWQMDDKGNLRLFIIIIIENR